MTWKNQWKVASLTLIMFIYYIINVTINPNCGGSHIDSPDWIKKEPTNPTNKKNNKCFQYTVTAALNHDELGKHSERITKIKTLINKYNWKQIYFPSEKDDWKNIEKHNENSCS